MRSLVGRQQPFGDPKWGALERANKKKWCLTFVASVNISAFHLQPALAPTTFPNLLKRMYRDPECIYAWMLTRLQISRSFSGRFPTKCGDLPMTLMTTRDNTIISQLVLLLVHFFFHLLELRSYDSFLVRASTLVLSNIRSHTLPRNFKMT